MIDKRVYIQYLQDMLEKVNSEQDAEQLLDAVFSIPFNALRNGDSIVLPKIGHVSVDKSKNEDCVQFVPDESLLQCLTKAPGGRPSS